jgi:hypothetical protein
MAIYEGGPQTVRPRLPSSPPPAAAERPQCDAQTCSRSAPDRIRLFFCSTQAEALFRPHRTSSLQPAQTRSRLAAKRGHPQGSALNASSTAVGSRGRDRSEPRHSCQLSALTPLWPGRNRSRKGYPTSPEPHPSRRAHTPRSMRSQHLGNCSEPSTAGWKISVASVPAGDAETGEFETQDSSPVALFGWRGSIFRYFETARRYVGLSIEALRRPGLSCLALE